MSYEETRDSFLAQAKARRASALDILVDAKGISWFGSPLDDRHMVYPIKEVKLAPEGEAEVADKIHHHLVFNGNGRSGLLQRLDLPVSYLNKCEKDLEATNVNYWLSRSSKEFVLRTVKGEDLKRVVRATVSTRFDTGKDDAIAFPPAFEQLEAVNKALEASEIKVIETSQSQDGDLSVFRCIFSICRSVFGGRTYQAGVEIINSETGRSTLSISPYITLSLSHKHYNFIDKSKNGTTKLRHTGELNPDKLRQAISEAADVAQLGLTVLLKNSTVFVETPKDEIEKIVGRAPAGTFSSKLMESLVAEMEDNTTLTKLQLAMNIMDATREMPMIRRYRVEKEIGGYLKLFGNVQKKVESIMEDAAKGEAAGLSHE